MSLSADGLRLAVGAPQNAGNGAGSGQVRVFDWDAGAWVQAGVDIDGEAAGDAFGSSVALSADGLRLAVGATANDGNGSNAGHVRVFYWSAGAWVQSSQDLDGEAPGDAFGSSVALSADGSRLAAGGSSNDGNGSGSGHVRVFKPEGERL